MNPIRKSYLLLALTPIVTVVLYFLNLQNTLQEINWNKRYQTQILNATSLDEQVENLSNQLNQIRINEIVQTDFGASLLKTVSDFEATNSEVQIVNISAPELTFQDQIKIQTAILELSGPFRTIQALLFEIEQEQRLGFISSASYERKFNRQSKSLYLYAKLSIQQFNKLVE